MVPSGRRGRLIMIEVEVIVSAGTLSPGAALPRQRRESTADRTNGRWAVISVMASASHGLVDSDSRAR